MKSSEGARGSSSRIETLERVTNASERSLERFLRTKSTRAQALLVATAAWAASLVLYGPALWVGLPPDSRPWDFMRQAANPLTAELAEPFLAFRIVPPAIAWITGLRGLAALLVPPLGAWLFLVLLFVWLRRHLDAPAAALACFLLALTQAVQVANTWIGYPDAVAWCCGVGILLARPWYAKALLFVLGALTEERFLLSAPLLVLLDVAPRDDEPSWSRLLGSAWPLALGAAGALAARRGVELAVFGPAGAPPSAAQGVYATILSGGVPPYVARVPQRALAAVCFSLRWGWVPVVVAAMRPSGSRRLWTIAGVTTLAGTYAVLCGGDWTRSMAFVWPLPVMAVVALGRGRTDGLARMLVACVLANAATPMINFQPTMGSGWMRPLPVAIARLVATKKPVSGL